MTLPEVFPLVVLLAVITAFIRITHHPIANIISIVMREFGTLLDRKPTEMAVNAIGIITLVVVSVIILLLGETRGLLRAPSSASDIAVDVITVAIILLVLAGTVIFSVKYCAMRR